VTNMEDVEIPYIIGQSLGADRASINNEPEKG